MNWHLHYVSSLISFVSCFYCVNNLNIMIRFGYLVLGEWSLVSDKLKACVNYVIYDIDFSKLYWPLFFISSMSMSLMIWWYFELSGLWGLGYKGISIFSRDMEPASIWTNSFQHQVCSFQEVLDWRFLVLGDFLLVSFVNCT